jgi:transcriptional regulator with XRE-family HTH domain
MMARPTQFMASPLPLWARRIKALRAGLRLNQLDFGKKLNCSSMVISRWERGLQKPPADCLIAMGKVAGPPDGWFFGRWQALNLPTPSVCCNNGRLLPLESARHGHSILEPTLSIATWFPCLLSPDSLLLQSPIYEPEI